MSGKAIAAPGLQICTRRNLRIILDLRPLIRQDSVRQKEIPLRVLPERAART
jgi:hypothetical protein